MRASTPSHSRPPPQATTNAPSSARQGDLRGGLNWRRQQSVVPGTRPSTKRAGAPTAPYSPGRKKRPLGFAQAARKPKEPVPVKQEVEEEEEVPSCDITEPEGLDDLEDLDSNVGGDITDVATHDYKAVAPKEEVDHALIGSVTSKSKKSTTSVPNRPSSTRVPVAPTTMHAPSSTSIVDEVSGNSADFVPSLARSSPSPRIKSAKKDKDPPPEIKIELLSARTTRSTEAYILTATLPAKSDSTSTTTTAVTTTTTTTDPPPPVKAITSQLIITPIPNSWFYQPPAPPQPPPKTHKSTNDRDQAETTPIPYTTLRLRIIKGSLSALNELGRITDTDEWVVLRAVGKFQEVLAKKYGVEVAGGEGAWGFCAFGPRVARGSVPGARMEVVVRRVSRMGRVGKK